MPQTPQTYRTPTYSSPALDAIRADLARRRAMRESGVSTLGTGGTDVGGNGDPFAGLFDEPTLPAAPAQPAPPQPQVENDPESSGWGRYGAMALRGLGALIPGGLPGAIGGGAAEFAAEKAEGRPVNPWQIGAQAVIGAIPFANWLKGGKLLGTMAKGAVMGAGGTTLSSAAEGRAPTLKELETSALIGGGTAGALRGFGNALGREGLAVTRAGEAETARVSGSGLPSNVAPPEGFSPPLGVEYPRVPGTLPPGYGRGAGSGLPVTNLEPFPSTYGASVPAPVISRVPGPMSVTSREPNLRPGVMERLRAVFPNRRMVEPPPGSVGAGLPTPVASHVPTSPMAVPPPPVTAAPSSLNAIRTMQDALEKQSGGRMFSFVGEPEFVNAVPAEAKSVTGAIVPTPLERPSALTGSLRDLMEQARANREGVAGTRQPTLDELDPYVAPEASAVAPPAARKLRIPPEITSLWQDLKPKWQASVDAQKGDQIPFTVDPTEDLLPFARRVLADDPSVLTGAERKVRAGLDAQGRDLQSGFITPEVAVKLGLPVAGGLVGATQDKEHPVRGALLGAGAGLALGHAPALMKNAEALRYFSMLSGPATQAKNIIGNVGAVGARSLENAISGKANAGAPLRELFSSQTLGDLVREFHTPQPGRWGQTRGVLGLPGRAMGAVDSATKDALARAGLSKEDARLITFTNTPRSDTGKAVVNFFRQAGPAARLVQPFSQTATNIVERGIERTPGLGLLAHKLTGGKLETNAARQLLGLAAVAGGSQIGQLPPVLQALLAPYTLPYQMGSAGGEAVAKGKSPDEVMMDAWNNGALDLVPAPMNKRAFDPRQWLAQTVPNILKDVSPTDPSTLDTKSLPLFGPTVAKLPFLNEFLLKTKKRTPRPPRATFARPSRRSR